MVIITNYYYRANFIIMVSSFIPHVTSLNHNLFYQIN